MSALTFFDIIYCYLMFLLFFSGLLMFLKLSSLLFLFLFSSTLFATVNIPIPKEYYLCDNNPLFFSDELIFMNAKKKGRSLKKATLFIFDKKTFALKKELPTLKAIGLHNNKLITLKSANSNDKDKYILETWDITHLQKVASEPIEIPHWKATKGTAETVAWEDKFLLHENQTIYDINSLHAVFHLRNKATFHAINGNAYSSYGRSFYRLNLDSFLMQRQTMDGAGACKALTTYQNKIYTLTKGYNGRNILEVRDPQSYKVLHSTELGHRFRSVQLSTSDRYIAVVSFNRNQIIDIYDRKTLTLQKAMTVKNLKSFGFSDEGTFMYTTSIRDMYNKVDIIKI